jgi:uncharacterized protein YceK
MTLRNMVRVGGALLALSALSGCGAVGAFQEPTQTDYIMVSQGKASLLYSAFVGGVKYCKITKHGIPHVNFEGDIVYEDGKCSVGVKSDVPR